MGKPDPVSLLAIQAELADDQERITTARAYAKAIWEVAEMAKEEAKLDVRLKALIVYGDLHGFNRGCLAPKSGEGVDEDELVEDPQALLETMREAVAALEAKLGRGGG